MYSVHTYTFERRDAPEIPAEELAACLDRVASRLLRRFAVRRPPVDALQWPPRSESKRSLMAGSRFVPVMSNCGRRGGNPRPAILLRPEPRSERRQWAVAHELGERGSECFQAAVGDPRTAPPTAHEWVANQLANRILLA